MAGTSGCQKLVRDFSSSFREDHFLIEAVTKSIKILPEVRSIKFLKHKKSLLKYHIDLIL
jgi:hypothetical protein